MASLAFPGLDLLSTAVVLLDSNLAIHYANPAWENLFATSQKNALGRRLLTFFPDSTELAGTLEKTRLNRWSYTGQDLTLTRAHHEPLQLNFVVTPIDHPALSLLVEFRQIDYQLKMDREERLIEQQEANRVFIRNLAHEIKNPLGGIRGAAQLLEHELDKASLLEYTQVIISEADRLQALMTRLLTPHRLPQIVEINIHEVLEQVCQVIKAQFSQDIRLERDYDVSLPDLQGDRDQLFQAIFNIALNAAQVLVESDKKNGLILFRTRALRQFMLARKLHPLALELQIIDNGPGISSEIQERIFYPLVSGREGGSGVGLTIAQTFVQQHQGIIECDSRPGKTCFKVILPFISPAGK